MTVDSCGRGLKGAAGVKFPTNKAFSRRTSMVLRNGISVGYPLTKCTARILSVKIIRHGLGSQMPIAWIFSKLPSKPESQGVDESYCSVSRSGLPCSSLELTLSAAVPYLQLPGVFSHISLGYEPFPPARALPGQGLSLLGSLNPKCLAQCIG